jgi:hypothetical protein
MEFTHSSRPRDRFDEWRFTFTSEDWKRAAMEPVHMALLRANRKSTKISEILAALAMVAAGVEKADAAGDHTSE